LSNNGPSGSNKDLFIVAIEEISSGVAWTNKHIQHIEIPANDLSYGGGQSNTNTIINTIAHTTSAAKLCNDYTITVAGTEYNDWYLPNTTEFNLLYNNRVAVDSTITSNSGDIVTLSSGVQYFLKDGANPSANDSTSYWTSNQAVNNETNAIGKKFTTDDSTEWYRRKNGSLRVRAIRKVSKSSGTYNIGDYVEGGVVFHIIDNGGASTPSVDLDITVGEDNTNVYSQNGLNVSTGNIVNTFTITSGMDKDLPITFTFTNSNTGIYNWGTAVRVFKEIEEITEEVVRKIGAVTLAYSRDMKRWTSRYSYIPEYMTTFKTGVASFRNGDLFIHDDTVNKNYFYGGSFPTYISYIENEFPSQPKVFLTHSIEGNAKPTLSTFETVENNKMLSDLESNDYDQKEGTFYSEMYGDYTDPNIEGSKGDKLLRGTKLRGQYIKVGVTFRENDLNIKHSNIGFNASKGHDTQP
jgi:hypothetical protein